jgi:phage-related protein
MEFIDSLDVKSKARIIRTLDLLGEFGINLGMPHARHLENQLWELRIRQSGNRYRVIYFLATKQVFILLHAFTKKTGPVLRRDIELAEKRQKHYLAGR